MKLAQKIKEVLEKQADHERLASVSYTAMSLWCKDKGYEGFAEFFSQQAKEEDEHTEKLHEHLLDRGAMPLLGALPAPESDYAGLTEVVGTALKLECANTEGIHAAYEAALEEKDYPAQVMLHWFIEEQVEEEAWANALFDKVRQAECAGALFDLDRHVVKLFGG